MSMEETGRPAWGNFGLGNAGKGAELETFGNVHFSSDTGSRCLSVQPAATWGNVPLSSAWRPRMEKYLVAVNQGFGPAPSH